MPATQFICPDGQRISILQCLTACPRQTRCMFLPTLRAIAKSVNRPIAEPTVTELIAGVRETYLKKTMSYAVSPQRVLYALQGQAIHTLHERCTQGEILSEIRLQDKITSGQFDLYGKILDTQEGVLGDLKVTSSYKLMKALGIYKRKTATGAVYKSGLRKGQQKYKTLLCHDGVRHVWDWAVQLNYYRMLLEQTGFPVQRMYIQAVCRDSGLRIAAERGIDQSLYIIPIYKISNRWIERYFRKKAALLQQARETHRLPPICSSRERWQDRKCLDYCDGREFCPYGQKLQQFRKVG
ncbi:MAG: hypothetical protein LKI76_00045 [Megasphaera sp.]|nr:hypothetical protein [Megasphaera sp.]